MQGDTDSDLARIRRQQIVLSSILQQVTSAGTLLNPAQARRLPAGLRQNTFTDNVSIDDLVTLAQSFGTLDPSRVTFFTLPTVPSTSDADALDVDESKAPAVFNALINDQPLPGEPAATEPPSTADDRRRPTSPPPRRRPATPSTRLRSTWRSSTSAAGRGWRPTAMEQLNAVGFAVTEDDLRRPTSQHQAAATVEYDAGQPGRRADRRRRGARRQAGADRWARHPGAAAARRVLRRDGQPVHRRRRPSPARSARPDGRSARGPSPAPTLTSGELPAINAGDALCA